MYVSNVLMDIILISLFKLNNNEIIVVRSFGYIVVIIGILVWGFIFVNDLKSNLFDVMV